MMMRYLFGFGKVQEKVDRKLARLKKMIKM